MPRSSMFTLFAFAAWRSARCSALLVPSEKCFHCRRWNSGRGVGSASLLPCVRPVQHPGVLTVLRGKSCDPTTV